MPQVPPRHVYLMIPPKLFAEEDGGIDCVCDDGDGAERGDEGGRCKTVSSKVPDLAKNHQRNSRPPQLFLDIGHISVAA